MDNTFPPKVHVTVVTFIETLSLSLLVSLPGVDSRIT